MCPTNFTHSSSQARTRFIVTRLYVPLLPILLFVVCGALVRAVQPSSLKGIVINSETFQPLENVNVYVIHHQTGQRFEVLTGPGGRFEFPGLSSGTYEFLASSIGYGLVKQTITVVAAAPVELQVTLSPGTHITNEVLVVGRSENSSVHLSFSEIDTLKSVLLDDSIRSLQQLPSMVSNDDFRTGFASQGSGFDRVGILLDGIPVYSMMHTIEGLDEETGSTTILSAELIQGIDFISGGSSSSWGNSSAGFLTLESRTGNNLRWRNLLSVSGSAFQFVSEGPVGSGSWIASGRKSYVDWIVRRIEPDSNLNFGFYDFFGKFSQNLGSRHQLSVSAIHGNTGLQDVVEGTSITQVDEGRLESSILHFRWDYSPGPSLAGSTHVYFQDTAANNRNQQEHLIWSSGQGVLGARTQWDFQSGRRLSWNIGATAEDWDVAELRNFYSFDQDLWARAYQYDASSSRAQLFAEGNLQLSDSASLRAGWNWSYQGNPGRGFHAPHLGLDFSKGSSDLSIVWGRSGQFPFFNQSFGPVGNLQLEHERADSVQAFWNCRLDEVIQFNLRGYYRTRAQVPWRKEGLWRLVNGRITPPSLDGFDNDLEDRTYGGELRLSRRAATGLSGWIAYAWSLSKWSQTPGEWFPGNYDQRNSLGMFGLYRWSSQFELSGKWKIASGLPIPAYAESDDGNRYHLAEARNLARLPLYSRFDVRFAKNFNKDRFRISLFVEVLNLFNRENLRFAGHDFDSVHPSTGRIYGLTQGQFPILPTAGMVVAF